MKFSQVLAVSLASTAASASLTPAKDSHGLYARGNDTAPISNDSSKIRAGTDDSTSSDDDSKTSTTSSHSESSTVSSTSSKSETKSNSSTKSESSVDETSASSESTTKSTTSSHSVSSSQSKTESTTKSESSHTSSSTKPTTYQTACTPVLGYSTPEDKIKLEVLFRDDVPGQGSTTFADYLVKYFDGILNQVESISNDAMNLGDDALRSALQSADAEGILDLASAAPMYSCYLSSVFAGAASNATLLARDPTAQQMAELIALFEKRENNGTPFNYAGILIDETEQLFSDVQSVASAALTATNMDYTTLFNNLDVNQLLSLASEAPIYTQGLSAAFESALAGLDNTTSVASTNSSVAAHNVSTVRLVSTAPAQTSYFYITNTVRGTTTITSCPPESTSSIDGYVTVETVVTPHVVGQSTIYETHETTVTICTRCELIASERLREVTICDETCVSIMSAASSAASTATVTSFETVANGDVITHTVVQTVCDEVCETLRAQVSSAVRVQTVVESAAPQTTVVRVTRAIPYNDTAAIRAATASLHYTPVRAFNATNTLIRQISQSASPARVSTVNAALEKAATSRVNGTAQATLCETSCTTLARIAETPRASEICPESCITTATATVTVTKWMTAECDTTAVRQATPAISTHRISVDTARNGAVRNAAGLGFSLLGMLVFLI